MLGKEFSLHSFFELFGVSTDPTLLQLTAHIRPVKFTKKLESRIGDNSSFFRIFVDSDGKLDTSCIYYDIPQICGCDLAFVPTLMLTLHPGTQYLQNWSREMLIAGFSPWRGCQMTPSQPHLNDHILFFTSAECPIALKCWVREGMVAMDVSNDVMHRMKAIEAESWGADVLVCLSMKSERWLPRDVRELFVTPSNKILRWNSLYSCSVVSVADLQKLKIDFDFNYPQSLVNLVQN